MILPYGKGPCNTAFVPRRPEGLASWVDEQFSRSRKARLFDLAFEKCLLNGCNFTEMVLKGAKFALSQVKECHFAQSNVKGGSFQGSNLEGSTFHHTNLEKCDFSEAENYAIDPLNNRLKGARFSRLEALSLLKGLEIVLE